MGGIGRVFAAAVSGGLSEVGRALDGTGTVNSFASGGLSDIVENGKAPFTSPINSWGPALGMDEAHQKWMEDLSAEMYSGGLAQLPKAYDKATKDGGFDTGAFIDRAIDPAGTIDYSLRKTGDNIYDAAPEVSPYLNTAGSVVGGVVGSYIPVIGTAAGAAIGSGVGNKLGSGTRTYDYGGDLVDAGISYAAGDLANTAAAAATGASGSNLVGGAVKGAMAGAVKGAPTAVETGNWDPVLYGAAGGALFGGAAGAYTDIFGDPSSYDELGGGIKDPEMYQKLVDEGMAPANYGYTDPDLYELDVAKGILPKGTSMFGVNSALPEGYKPLEYGSNTFEQSPFKTDYKLNPSTGSMELDKPSLYAFSDDPNAYGSKEFFTKAQELGMSPNQALDLDDTSLGGVSANVLAKPSLWESTKSTMEKVGKGVTDNKNALLKIAGMFNEAGTAGTAGILGEEGRRGSTSPDDNVTTIIASLPGKKSAKKALTAEEVEASKYYSPDMFLKDVKGYDQQEEKLYS